MCSQKSKSRCNYDKDFFWRPDNNIDTGVAEVDVFFPSINVLVVEFFYSLNQTNFKYYYNVTVNGKEEMVSRPGFDGGISGNGSDKFFSRN